MLKFVRIALCRAGCGFPGHIRIAFGRPAPGPAFEEAAAKLKKGLTELVSKGMPNVS